MRRVTAARIGIGRSGTAIPTQPMLEFQLGYARARDAVYTILDEDAIAAATAPRRCVTVSSRAPDRSTYLLRPDFGRMLNTESVQTLSALKTAEGFDLVFVIADGLSAGASRRYAPDMVNRCCASLGDLTVAPLVLATQGRVAIGDHVAQVLGARSVIVLLGERPGLTTPESLGLYFTWHPSMGALDSSRNCISNIHDSGLNVRVAADTAIWLLREATRLKLSGVGLKENFTATSGALASETTAIETVMTDPASKDDSVQMSSAPPEPSPYCATRPPTQSTTI